MSHQSHLTPLIRVCQTADVHLLLVLLNLLLQTTEFLTENHRAASACLFVCACVRACVSVSQHLFLCVFLEGHKCVFANRPKQSNLLCCH